MRGDMPSPRSCRVVHAYQDVAAISCMFARHDQELRRSCSSVRQKQAILSCEDSKVYKKRLKGTGVETTCQILGPLCSFFPPPRPSGEADAPSGSCRALRTDDMRQRWRKRCLPGITRHDLGLGISPLMRRTA